MRRTLRDIRESAYTDPLGVARWLLATGRSLPVDLETELVSMGIDVEGLRNNRESPNVGFSIAETMI